MLPLEEGLWKEGFWCPPGHDLGEASHHKPAHKKVEVWLNAHCADGEQKQDTQSSSCVTTAVHVPPGDSHCSAQHLLTLLPCSPTPAVSHLTH